MHFALPWLVLGWFGAAVCTATRRAVLLVRFNVSREDPLLCLLPLNLIGSQGAQLLIIPLYD